MINTLPKVVISTDGSCDKDGRGGWATAIHYVQGKTFLCGNAEHVTNNRMELLAAVRGLEKLVDSCRVTLISDSRYVIDGIQLVDGWIRRGWRNGSGRKVANRDLWERIVKVKNKHKIKLHWLKGHAGHVINEQVDSLAQLMRTLPLQPERESVVNNN